MYTLYIYHRQWKQWDRWWPYWARTATPLCTQSSVFSVYTEPEQQHHWLQSDGHTEPEQQHHTQWQVHSLQSTCSRRIFMCVSKLVMAYASREASNIAVICSHTCIYSHVSSSFYKQARVLMLLYICMPSYDYILQSCSRRIQLCVCTVLTAI